MKTRIFTFLLAVSMFFTFGQTAFSQSDRILGDVENTKMFNVIELINMDRELSTFANLVALSGLGPSMAIADDYTVLAPTNDAFGEMSIERFLHLTNPKNKTDLVTFVKLHFVPKKVMKSDFNNSQVIDNESSDKEIPVHVDYGSVYLDGARVLKSDISASNGVIHILDRVIEPSDIVTN